MNNMSIQYVDISPNSITFVKQVDLSALGIKNDGTSPVETSAGINQALQLAKEQNFSKMIFPTGNYLIHEASPIVIDTKNIIIDLNGSTVQMNSSGPEYSIVEIKAGAENVRIINGTIIGNILINA